MVLFQSLMLKELIDSKSKDVSKNDNTENDNIKEIKLKDLSPNIRKIKENKMNRIKSMDNFIKFTWSWTM